MTDFTDLRLASQRIEHSTAQLVENSVAAVHLQSVPSSEKELPD